MIKYRLGCDNGHEFESWFQSSTTFEKQAARALVSCPICGSHAVDRLPMAPAVVGSKTQSASTAGEPAIGPATAADAKALMNDLRQLKRRLLQDSDYVGAGFAEEARKIHFGESQNRQIHGEATAEEARELAGEGIPFGVLPVLPEEQN